MSATCNAVGCQASRGRGALMCRVHWFRVPMLLRQRVSETWRIFNRSRRPEGITRESAYLDYIEARDEAVRVVAHLEGNLAGFVPDLPRIRRLQEARR